MEQLLRGDASVKRRRNGKPSPLSSISPPEDEEELCLVMQEIAHAIGAIALVLTIQEDNGDRSVILRNSDSAFNSDLLHRLHEDEAFLYDESASEAHRWKNVTVDSVVFDIMIMPVKRTIGHQRMVLSALFDSLDRTTRLAAERAYLNRSSFAVGYFRLWQIDRARHRREKALEAGLNSFGVGFVLLDYDLKIVFANLPALELLGQSDGLRIDVDRIHATNLIDGVRLRAALDHVTAPGAREATMLAIARSSGVSLPLLALPIECQDWDIGAVAAVIYLIDPAANLIPLIEPICKIYKLTSSETKLACLLASGRSLIESSEKMNIKEQTARSTLKQIFRKTETTRQGELIYLMLSSIIRTNKIVSVRTI